MKPSRRIKELTAQALASLQQDTKAATERHIGRALTGEEWERYLKTDGSSTNAMLAVTAWCEATQMYLDEQHNAAEQAKEFQVPIGVTEHGDKVYGI